MLDISYGEFFTDTSWYKMTCIARFELNVIFSIIPLKADIFCVCMNVKFELNYILLMSRPTVLLVCFEKQNIYSSCNFYELILCPRIHWPEIQGIVKHISSCLISGALWFHDLCTIICSSKRFTFHCRPRKMEIDEIFRLL